MKLLVDIDIDEFKIFLNSKLKESIPAFVFMGSDGNCVFGKEAYRAINLYPDRVFSLNEMIIEKNKYLQSKLFSFVHKYVKEKYNQEDYKIKVSFYIDEQISSGITQHMSNATKKTDAKNRFYIIKNGIHETYIKNYDNKMIIADIELIKSINNVIGNGMASIIMKNYRLLPGHYFVDVKKIIMRNIDVLRRKLISGEQVQLQIKIIDDYFFVHKLCCKIKKDDIDGIEIIELLRQINSENEKNIREQFIYNALDCNYKVTLISPFSYGKSTILNGIMGDSLLKADVRAETAIITKISSGKMNKLYIRFKSGNILTSDYMNQDELKNLISQYTSVRSDKEIPEEIHIVSNAYNLPGITLVDAPGLFSPHKEHNAIADKALEISELIMFVVNPGRIGDKNFTEKINQYINYITKNNKRFCFVLSKFDLYEQDKSVILNEFDVVLESLKLKDSKVFFVSGYFALKGKQLRDGKIDIDQVRKSSDIYVVLEDDFIAGRAIEYHHYREIIEFSGIEVLENYILQRGGTFEDKRDDLDNRQQKIS